MNSQRLSAIDIAVLSREMSELCVGSKIEKILRGPSEVEFMTESICFAFRIRNGVPYLILTDKAICDSNWLPFLFDGAIEKVYQVRSDRIIAIQLIKRDRLGRKKNYSLFFEMFGPGNLIVTTAGLKILACFRSSRGKNPGEIYEIGGGDFREAKEVFAEPATSGHDAARTYRLLENGDGRIVGFAESTPEMSDFPAAAPRRLIDILTEYVQSMESLRTDADRLRRQREKIAKAESKIKQIEAEIADSEKAGEFRKFGNLILTNLGKIQKGDRQLVLPDIDSISEKYLRIPLDPALNPQANARRYFEKARKMEIARGVLVERLERQRAALERLRSPESSRREPIAQKQKTDRMREKLPFRHFDLGNGWHIYAGKSAESNDELTFGFAAKNDLWFHAWQSGGSHVILRKPNKQSIADKAILEKAASLAAYYSKSRTSAKAPVVYAEVRYLRKVKGTPGKVMVNRQKQLMVKPQSPASLFGEKTKPDD